MSKVYIKGLKGLIINSIEESVQYVVTKAAFERCAEELAVAMNMAPGALTGGEWPSWHALLGQVRENLAAIQDLRAERENLRADIAKGLARNQVLSHQRGRDALWAAVVQAARELRSAAVGHEAPPTYALYKAVDAFEAWLANGGAP